MECFERHMEAEKSFLRLALNLEVLGVSQMGGGGPEGKWARRRLELVMISRADIEEERE